MSHYTDEDVEAALSVTVNRDLCEHELALASEDRPILSWVCEPCEMRAVLDAVAPAIAARALRDFAKRYPSDGGLVTCRSVREWLIQRAGDIANGRI